MKDNRSFPKWISSSYNAESDSSKFRGNIENIFRVLNIYKDHPHFEYCSTRVRIRLANANWSANLQKFKKLAQAIIIYGRCIDELMPEDRCSSGNLMSNRSVALKNAATIVSDIGRLLNEN
jgi:hypothetical protein